MATETLSGQRAGAAHETLIGRTAAVAGELRNLARRLRASVSKNPALRRNLDQTRETLAALETTIPGLPVESKDDVATIASLAFLLSERLNLPNGGHDEKALAACIEAMSQYIDESGASFEAGNVFLPDETESVRIGEIERAASPRLATPALAA